MSTLLFDKYINGSLSSSEQKELEEILKDEEIQREFVEYTVETHAYVSMLNKQANEPKKKVKRQSKVLPFLMFGAAAVLAVFFYLNLNKYRNFSLDGAYIGLNEKISVDSEQKLSAFDGSYLVLKPGTELEILSVDPTEIQLYKGEVIAEVMPQKESFKIIAGKTVTKVLGTQFKLFKNGDQVDLFVEEGKVSFGTKESSLIFAAGEGGRVDEDGLARLAAPYKKWYDWSRDYAQRDDVFVYLNFHDETSLNNIAELTKETIVFENRYGDYEQGRWSEKLALKSGGLESLKNSALELGQNFTIWSWTKLNKEEKIYPPIVNADKPAWRLQFSRDGDFIHTGHNTNVLDGKILLEKEKWQFMAVTFTRETAKVYVNGKFDQSMPGEDSSLLPQSLKIGYYNQFGIFRVFNGLIGEVAIQKGALSEQEIKELYEATRP